MNIGEIERVETDADIQMRNGRCGGEKPGQEAPERRSTSADGPACDLMPWNTKSLGSLRSPRSWRRCGQWIADENKHGNNRDAAIEEPPDHAVERPRQ